MRRRPSLPRGTRRRGSRRDASRRAEKCRSPMTHLLVVDDSPTVRLTLRSWLEPAGHQVDEAADGVAALVQLAALPGPLVVLLDYQMPGLTGFEVRQRALAERPGPPDYGEGVISAVAGRSRPGVTGRVRRTTIQ